MAISALKRGLRMVSQQATRFYQRVGYHPYEGLTEDFAERARILANLGQNRTLILHTTRAIVAEGARPGRGFGVSPSRCPVMSWFE